MYLWIVRGRVYTFFVWVYCKNHISKKVNFFSNVIFIIFNVNAYGVNISKDMGDLIFWDTLYNFILMGRARQLRLVLFIGSVFFASCKDRSIKKTVKVPAATRSFSFQKEGDFSFNEVVFNSEGAFFNDDENLAYIRINDFKKKVGNDFNLSFWVRNIGEPKDSQVLINIKDTINSYKRFKLWLGGRRLTGIFNSDHFWAKDYDYKNSKSKAYYDSYQLDNGRFYFLSLNVSRTKIEIFIDSEPYQTFKFAHGNSINIHEILIGAEESNRGLINQFSGNISFFKIFTTNLTLSEIYSLNREKLDYFNKINDAHELKKFNH